MEILYGGIPGRPIGDGMDGHSWWPLFENIPTEYLEAYYPLRVDGYTTVTDSGGAGLHRGGNGVEKRYVYLEPGQVSIHDDRWLTRPWGVLGGEPGERSTKLLRRADGTEEVLPAKCDEVAVAPGDMLVYRTAGGGGWKDRLDRPVEAVARDVSFGLVSAREGAAPATASSLRDDGTVDEAATDAERERQREERGPATDFDFGPPLDETLAACEAETGLPAPSPARAAALGAAGGRRVGDGAGAGGGRRRRGGGLGVSGAQPRAAAISASATRAAAPSSGSGRRASTRRRVSRGSPRTATTLTPSGSASSATGASVVIASPAATICSLASQSRTT